MNCPKCGRFCSSPSSFQRYTGTWNDIILTGVCSTHGSQEESTV